MPLPAVPHAFSLPLSRDDFRRALYRGQGRAFLHVSAYGATHVEDVILDALVTHRAFDPQLEGDRSDWLMQIVDAAGLETEAREMVIDRLLHIGPEDGWWSLDQRCFLAAIFAKQGHRAARDALYHAFRKGNDCSNLVAAEQIIQIGGSDGLIFLAQRIGEWYISGGEDWTYDEPITWFNELHGQDEGEKILTVAAEDDYRIAAYLRQTCEFRADDEAALEPKPSRRKCAEEIIRQAESDTSTRLFFPYRTWGRNATETERRVVLERVLREADELVLCRLLAVFMYRPMEQFDSRLLQLAEHPSEDVRWWAIQALANYTHDEVRSLAVERARKGKTSLREIELFRLNYLPGDWATAITPHSELPEDDDDLHEFLQSLLDVFEERDLLECAHPLMLVYEHSPCSRCRERGLRSLLKLHAAPDWLLKECAHDCSGDIRKMAVPPGLPLK